MQEGVVKLCITDPGYRKSIAVSVAEKLPGEGEVQVDVSGREALVLVTVKGRGVTHEAVVKTFGVLGYKLFQ